MRCQSDDKPPEPLHGPGRLVTAIFTYVYQCNGVHCHTAAFPWLIYLTSWHRFWLLATSLERSTCEDTGYLSVVLWASNVTQVERFASVCYVIMSSRVAFPQVVHTWQADKWSVMSTTVPFRALNDQVHELWERRNYDQEAFGKVSVRINEPWKQKDTFSLDSL